MGDSDYQPAEKLYNFLEETIIIVVCFTVAHSCLRWGDESDHVATNDLVHLCGAILFDRVKM